MANKQVKDLKPGDTFHAAVSDGRTSYIAWVKIIRMYDIVIYDSESGAKNNGRVEGKKIFYTPTSGGLKGDKYDTYIADTVAVVVPNQPGKLRKIWNALVS